jgi:ribosomal protein S27AE
MTFGKTSWHVDTVQGQCPECDEQTLLIAVVEDFYRCTSCGADTKQYVNGHIKYLKINDEDKKWLKRKRSASTRS